MIKPLEEEHMKYLWASYRKRAWEEIPEGLTQDQLREFVSVLCSRSNLMVIEAPNKYPIVGIISCREDRFYLEPHVDWMPWATDRNKLEGTARAVLFLREIKPLLIWSKESTKEFFTHVCKYGILKRIGTFNGSEQFALFQGK